MPSVMLTDPLSARSRRAKSWRSFGTPASPVCACGSRRAASAHGRSATAPGSRRRSNGSVSARYPDRPGPGAPAGAGEARRGLRPAAGRPAGRAHGEARGRAGRADLRRARRRLHRTIRATAQASWQTDALYLRAHVRPAWASGRRTDHPSRRGRPTRRYRDERADEREPHAEHPVEAVQLVDRIRAA